MESELTMIRIGMVEILKNPEGLWFDCCPAFPKAGLNPKKILPQEKQDS